MTDLAWVPLGQLVTIAGGGTPQRDNPSYFGGDIPWVTPKDMKTSHLSGSQIRITDLGLRESATKLVPANSVLIVVRSGVLKHSIPVAINRVPVALNQDMKALTAGPKVDPEYLAHFLRAAAPTILTWVRATTADNFPIEKLRSLEVPLPDLPKQRRIADILDRADALRAKRRKSLVQLDGLNHSLFRTMFGGEKYEHGSWPLVTVGEFATTITKGTTPTTLGFAFAPRGIPFIRVLNLFGGGVDEKIDARYISRDVHLTLARSIIKPGDVLISIAGTVGRVGLVGNRYAEMNCNQAVAIIRTNGDRVLGEFLAYWLMSASAQRQMRGAQVTATVTNLSLGQLRSMRLRLPPMHWQSAFVDRTAQTERIRALGSRSMIQLDSLFYSLQRGAFVGQL
ncbi:MAG TPA: restriction endonuclease subunit S [Candidatus Dormibacteraeota bacterium]|nr:restriction endonuclease subunit S [Candidatus Dormibacteraeota bacterium]